METSSFLVFSLQQSRFAINAGCVKEIFSLPELTPIEEVPEYIVGVVNLRGKIVPIMDINVRLGRRPQRYQVSDKVIVTMIKEDQMDLGLIVSNIHDVQGIRDDQIETTHFRHAKADIRHRIIYGNAKLDEDIIMLINSEVLLHQDALEGLMEGASVDLPGLKEQDDSLLPLKDRFVFCPDATPEERDIFRERARNLRRTIQSQEFTGLMPLAVIGLGREYFAVDLDMVREFADIHDITPVPCCPDFIIGNMNLRGDILTVIDIRSMLKLARMLNATAQKVMVINVDDLRVGVLVDNIFDVVYLNPAEISTVPAAVKKTTKDEFISGTAFYERNMISIIDLKKLMLRDELNVNEEV